MALIVVAALVVAGVVIAAGSKYALRRGATVQTDADIVPNPTYGGAPPLSNPTYGMTAFGAAAAAGAAFGAAGATPAVQDNVYDVCADPGATVPSDPEYQYEAPTGAAAAGPTYEALDAGDYC